MSMIDNSHFSKRTNSPDIAGLKLTGKRRRRKKTIGRIVRRTLLVIFTIPLLLLFALFTLCQTIATGPSETVRDLLVLSAMQASATKWVPGLFLDEAVVEEIVKKSQVIQTDVVPLDEYVKKTRPDGIDETDDNSDSEDDVETDEWANAIDGMLYYTVSGPTYKAYILIVRDPSRVYVGTSSDYKSGKIGARIFDIVEREGAVAAINGGEFADTNGQGTGDNPIGLTYARGNCVWNDGAKRTFIGFDKNNKLIVTNSMTKKEADELGIRDGVSFQTGNVLITNDGVNITLHYAEGNTGTAQRTAIGQRADGSVVMIVTDGRTASSLGATRNDVIDLLASFGAITAGMLDGGSSTMMYYRDYYDKYNIDKSTLDTYQLMGLTNRYKAFTKPRHLPTFFLVSPETSENG